MTMTLTDALNEYRQALDEAAFLESDRIRAWADLYRKLFDGRPWSQVEAAIRAELAELDSSIARVSADVKMAKATLDVEMLKVQIQAQRAAVTP